MTKTLVTKLFVGGTIAVTAGIVAAFAAVFGLFTSGAFVMSGPDVVGFNSSPVAWVLFTLALAGCAAMIGGAIAGFVAWVGALLNTAQLDDKVWFILLLVLGVWSLGFFAMIAYIVAGPDSTLRGRRSVELAPQA